MVTGASVSAAPIAFAKTRVTLPAANTAPKCLDDGGVALGDRTGVRDRSANRRRTLGWWLMIQFDWLSRRFSRVGIRRAVLFVVAAGLVPVRLTSLTDWTVRIVDERGGDVQGLTVSEEWTDYRYDERDWREALTNDRGFVRFPKWTRWRPLMYLAARRALVIINVHAGGPLQLIGLGAEHAGLVTIAHNSRIEGVLPGVGMRAACNDADCKRGLLSSTILVKSVSR